MYMVVWRTTCIWWFGGRRVYGGLEDDVLRWFGGRRVYGGLEDDVYTVDWRTTCIQWFGGRRVYGGLEDDVYMVVLFKRARKPTSLCYNHLQRF